MVDETMGARCRNCGNTGISPWTGEPCGCKHGKALAHLAPQATTRIAGTEWEQLSSMSQEQAIQVRDAAAQDVLMESADVANCLMMLCQGIGALPPTDERGR